jgi:hypothetical protein
MTAALALFAVVTWTLGAWRSAIFGENFVPMAPVTAWLFLLAAAAKGPACARRRPAAPES